MKHLLSLNLFLICSFVLFGQSKQNFAAIDAKSKSIGFLPLNELTKKLTAPYSDEMDKARAIYSWIAYHVGYDDAEFDKEDPLRYDKRKFANINSQAVFDSLWTIEHANFALKNHRGICGEYAALFKVMCDLTSIKCVIVNGYGKWDEWIGKPYEENHSWNALFLKGKWQLSDVTWGAGYWDEKKKKSVQH
ncbi:MAG TPA: transglutaminase domain-containing protein, partial [Arachidicoccus sp.]